MAGTTKAAKRLSLNTAPKANGEKEARSMSDGPTDSKSAGKRAQAEAVDAPAETAHGDREQVSSRSASPSAPFSGASEQSKSPTSPASPTFTSLPQYPPGSPEKAAKAKEQSRGFFQNLKASRSATKLQTAEQSIRTVQQEPPPPPVETPRGPQRTKSTPEMRETSPDPVPDIPRLDQKDGGSQTSLQSGNSGHAIPRRPVGLHSGSRSNTWQSVHDANQMGQSPPQHAAQSPPQGPAGSHEFGDSKKNSNRLFTSFMRRNHHNRSEDHGHTNPSQSRSGTRSRSANRAQETSQGKPPSRDQSATRGSDVDESMDRPSSKSHMKGDGTGARLFREFRQQAGHAAKETQKLGGRFFRHRNSSNTAPPPDFSNYEIKVINQSLVKQTRLTRIAKRLEDSKDKTEFWMPALPWRCIDYLNFNGAETEGLYRVPGSEREVRLWKARFDQEYDIDLFQEEELYDVNTIGSLFKSWLRDLPEDILPTSTQDELTGRYAGEQKAPEEVKEVLSQLPPWNYYLLFAITCHLSLLHAYAEKNKMTFNNLFVCFAPALRLNGDCFRWLVGDWRACWIGCATEKEALEEEYRILDFGGPELMPEPNPPFAQENRPSGSRKASSTSSSVDATPRAEDFRSSPHQGASQFAMPGKGVPGASSTSQSLPSTGVAASSTGQSHHNASHNSSISSASSKPQGRRPAKTGSSSTPHSREGSLQTSERKVMPTSERVAKETTERKTKESAERKPKETGERRRKESAERRPKEATEKKHKESTEKKPKASPVISPPQPARPKDLLLKESAASPAVQSPVEAQSPNKGQSMGQNLNVQHVRANSQLPELNLPQPISPTFSSAFLSKEGA